VETGYTSFGKKNVEREGAQRRVVVAFWSDHARDVDGALIPAATSPCLPDSGCKAYTGGARSTLCSIAPSASVVRSPARQGLVRATDMDFLTAPVPTGLNLTGSSLAICVNIFLVWCLFYFNMVFLWYLLDMNETLVKSCYFNHIIHIFQTYLNSFSCFYLNYRKSWFI
jgi:hypothetical protein